MMTYFVKAFIWGFMFAAVSAASTNVSNVPKTSVQKGGETTVTKCNTVINHVNNYHGRSGSNDEIKTVLSALQAVQGQLSEVQQDIRELKAAKGNKTGENTFTLTVFILAQWNYLTH